VGVPVGDQMSAVEEPDFDLAAEDEPSAGKQPAGTQGYTARVIDKHVDAIIRRHGLEPSSLTVICGLDGCAERFTGHPDDVFKQRDAHRRRQHARPPVAKQRPRMVPLRQQLDRARERASKASQEAAAERKEDQGRTGRPIVHTKEATRIALGMLATQLGRTPTWKEAKADRRVPAENALRRMYGENWWKDALADAGLEPNRQGRTRKDAA
jgi:hypothetical protein